MIKAIVAVIFFGSMSSAFTVGNINNPMQSYVENNQAVLVREMARGFGDKLSTLAAFNGCVTDAQISAFNSRARSSFKTIVPTENMSAGDLVSNLMIAAIAEVCSGS